MPVPLAVSNRLTAIQNLKVLLNEPLAPHTRFGVGGPAAVFCDASTADACSEALRTLSETSVPHVVIGGGTNLVVSDRGFDGVILRYTGAGIERDASRLKVAAGAVLQDVVDRSTDLGLKGLETMTGIPGYVGGAVYGNAGAYGHSIQELVEGVVVTDGASMATLDNAACRFAYRESVFKTRKDWIILSTVLRFNEADSNELKKIARDIREIRDAKYPPAMKCAGSIFKNVFFANLPPNAQAAVPSKLVRDGKVPSAFFLEEAGAKGLRRGDIQVASYHANLIYNDGAGTAADVAAIIAELKGRVRDRFGFELEEEVQYVGFQSAP